MVLTNRKYNFISTPLFLGLYFVVIASFTLMGRQVFPEDTWLQSLLPFLKLSSLTPLLSVTLIGIQYSAILYVLHKLNNNILSIGNEKFLLLIVYLIFSFISVGSVRISGAIPATLFILISLYYTIIEHKAERFIFLAGLFISLAVLFEPRFFPLIIFPAWFVLFGRELSVRKIIILIHSLILPFLLTASLFQLFTGRLQLLIKIFIQRISLNGKSVIIEESSVGYVLLIVIFFISIISIYSIFSRLNKFKILKAMAFYRLIALLVGLLIIYFIYPSISETFSPIIAIPLSVLISEQISSREYTTTGRVMFLVFLILLFIKKIYSFI